MMALRIYRERTIFLAFSFSLIHSAIISMAPAVASAVSATEFDIPTYFAAAFSTWGRFCAMICRARGSRPFSRAISAFVRLLGLNGRYMSSNTAGSRVCSMRSASSGVMAPASFITDTTYSRRFRYSLRDSSLSCMDLIWDSSSSPVASFL